MARYRPVYVKIWGCDEKFQEYSKDGKLLFIYLITNDHLSESGIYKITYKTMANETDIPKEEVKKLINGELKNNVSYDEDKSVVFVYKFLEHNGGGSPKLVKKSIDKDRETIKTHLWKEFDKFYSKDLKPLDNPLPKDSSITNSNSNTNSKEDRPSLPNLTQIEKKILKELKEVKNFPLKKPKDFENTLFFIRKLVIDFPEIDALEEIKKKCAWWLQKPLLKKSNPHLQIRNWFLKAKEFLKEGDKERRVGKSYVKKPQFLSMELLNKVYQIIDRKGGDKGKFYDKARSAFPIIRTQWEQSDKKPETFIRLVESVH